MAPQKRSPAIDISPNLGLKVTELRKKRGWTQERLQRITRDKDIDGIGVSLRRLRALERQEDNRFRIRTLTLIANAFGLSLNSFLQTDITDYEVAHLWTQPPIPPTHLFEQDLEVLQRWIRQGQPKIVVEGNSGIGKSSLLSALNHLQPEVNLVWFDGNQLSQLDQTCTQLQQLSSQTYLMLDEDYQPPVRDIDFFTEVLESRVWQSLNKPNIIFSLRSQTYQKLAEKHLLSGCKVVSLQLTADCLDHSTAWSIDPPLSAQEKIWILDQFQTQPINTLLIDNVYLPYLLSVRDQLDHDNRPLASQGNTVLANIYQNFILRQSSSEQQMALALSRSMLLTNFPTLFLIAAIESINQPDDAQIRIQEILDQFQRSELIEAQTRKFFERPPDWQAPTIYRFRFKHDLFHQSIDHHQRFSLDLDKKDQLPTHLCQLIDQQVVNLSTLSEAVATYLSLAQYDSSLLPIVADSIAGKIDQLLETGKVELMETAYLIFSMTWFGCSDLGLEGSDNLNLYSSLQQLANPLVNRFNAEHLKLLLRKNVDGQDLFPLMGWAHTLYKIGVASGQIQPNVKWLLSEHQIPILNSLGQRLTADLTEIPPPVTDTNEFAFLLMWAEQWTAAGDILGQQIENWNPLETLPTGLEVFMAFKCYQASQNSNKLDSYIQLMIDKTDRQPDLQPLIEYFGTLIKKPLPDRKKISFANQFHYDQIDTLVTGDPVTSSRLCQAIRSLGYSSQLIIENPILEIETVERLSMSLILVGNVLGDNSLMEKYIPDQDREEFNNQVTYYPYEGRVQFQIACWIKGGWDQKTADLVDNFIQSQDLVEFLKG